ncbi:Tetratricopeptide repeat protein 37 [Chionoecetes opilio]|uniref:Tetratricopeptide repeat protein 37 n=1 Tax=Chionoecetes opilio TaxID=41210 RepID=A0A8J4XYS7_CHIOP|nr:Tetratricopeptide repeat protein 37 [Chionoecetes opilio]
MLVDRLTGEKKIVEVWRSIAQTLSTMANLPEEHTPKLQEALEHSLNDSVLGENETNYQSYLRLLYRTGQLARLVVAAQTMARIFPTYLPLEWICRMFVRWTAYPVEGNEFPLSQEETTEYMGKLLRINKASPWGNLARGLMYREEGSLVEAKAHLRLGADNIKNSLMGWELLRSVQEESSDWPGVETSCRKSLAILSGDARPTVPGGEDPQAYETRLRLTQARALVHMGHKNHLKKAVDMLEQYYKTDLDCGLLLVRSKIKLLEFDMASEALKELESIFGSRYQLKFFSASLLRAQGERQQARQLLEELVKEEPGFAEGHLELGRLYFEIGEMKQAQVCCMRAGKLDPKLAQAFLYLGHFFRHQDNMDKALKCYEKALSLSPCDDDVGAALSDLYRVLGQYEANIQLLHRVTREGGRASCGWAWLRLGLHHLALRSHEPAIQAFQCALTINPHDGSGYECLGDTYLARGAFSAALKVFTHASHLNPAALYPLYQIAHIKQASIVGENLQSVEDFAAVLKWDPLRPVCVVSLVGLAEALLATARKHQEQCFLTNVKDDCTQAITCLIRAASMKPECSCIWKLMGDACVMLYPMPPSLAPFTLPARLVHRETQDLEETVEVTKVQVLQMGIRCYGLALQGNPEDATLWHDLGLNTYLQARAQEGSTGGPKEETPTRELLNRAIQALKKGLTLDPSNGKMWSSLGIVASHKLCGNNALAQHSLIKACVCQPSAAAWTNLGAFYLSHGKTQLAHEAFSQAQSLDPAFVTCWVGQALVAEGIGHTEMFDLFRHTTLLGIHSESSLGYAHHVTDMACDPAKHSQRAAENNLKQALPTATDCTVFYTRGRRCRWFQHVWLDPGDDGPPPVGNKAYEMALDSLKQNQGESGDVADGVRANLGRTLTAQGRAEEAMAHFSAIKEPDYFTQCGLALASLKAGKFEEAYNGYTAALHWLAPDDAQKSHILVALASLQYKFQNSEEAKKLLFQGSQLQGASVRGLLVLAALGLVLHDAVLTNAALAELTAHQHHKEHLHNIAFLRAAEATSKGNIWEARCILSRTLHQHPSSAPLWRALAHHLLTHLPSSRESRGAAVIAATTAAAACASAAAKLTQAAGSHKTIAQDAVTSVLATMELERARQSSEGISLRQAQRAVLMCPGSPEAWAMFLAARVLSGHAQTKNVCQLAQIWSHKASPGVSSWLKTLATGMEKVA